MAQSLKMFLAVVVALTPGGFVFLVAYVFGRAFRARWHQAQAQAPGRSVSLRGVLADLHFKDLVREARAAL